MTPEHLLANSGLQVSPPKGFDGQESVSAIPADPPIFDVLHEAVDFYFMKSGVRQYIIAKQLGVSYSWLSGMRLKGKTAMPASSSLLQSLEESLGAPSGTFTRFVISPRVRIHAQSKFVKRLVELREKPRYRLRPSETTTPLLHFDLLGNFKFKTSKPEKLFDKNSLDRGQPWRLRKVEDFHRIEEWQLPYCTTFDGTMVSPTAQMFVADVSAFFGALYEIDPALYSQDKYSLAWMCSADLMGKVVSNLVVHYGGYNSTVHNIVLRGKTLINPKYGFVTQNPYLSRSLVTPVLPENWSEWVDEQNVRLSHGLGTVRELGTKSLRRRDPEDPIKEFLNWQHPTDVIEMLITKMTESLPRLSGLSNRCAMRRDSLLVRMLREQPLRSLMYGNLTCTDDNQGSLYKRYRADGSYLWAIRFNADDFRNWRTAQYKRYDVCFSAETSEEIDKYFGEVYKHYPEGTRVFKTWKWGDVSGGKCKVDQLERIMLFRTKDMIEGCVGFGMNAFRNLVATEIIQNDDDGYQIAADVLHDDIETVRENFGHVAAKRSQSKYVERIRSIRQEGREELQPTLSATIADPSDAIRVFAQRRGISHDQAWAEMSAWFASEHEEQPEDGESIESAAIPSTRALDRER